MEPPQEPAAGTRRRRRRGGGKNRRKSSSSQQAPLTAAAPPPPSSPPAKRRRKAGADQVAAKPKMGNTASLLDKMRARLSGGHFRMLNEKLYTCSGQDAFDYFKDDPNLFDVYHSGYHEQMSHWPEQPVNVIISWLKSHNASWTVADFGCGNAAVAKNVKNKVFSIDLVSDDPSVIACDMAHTPLEPSSVDVAIFCLSLMGTNYPSYLEEANRVLKPSGWLVIAEVRSRLDPNTGGADPEKFSEGIIQLGYSLVLKDAKNKMFILFYFRKKEKSKVVKNIDWPQLKPCLYKRR
ncbi:ribosomal RNA-processing protein 8-like [Phragmites australis]|uniref:ribosomal RNA-processing protein 8-like n=1 Tax=Phragmites australis TaxID=29695 RepID=UPI002D78BD11|nr:ribosomal RNA-processing protein 8-like [Phragmites australis]XP_062222887.1 ribosomal RNA-processing protein 8-like [Phragmites australis]XP_062222888.1 ribosomal RNA-processing protein 8-like [Phragmites australis]